HEITVMTLGRRWRGLWERLAPVRRLRVVEGDSLPPKLPWRDLVVARDGDEDWCVGLRCPCGCRSTIGLLVNPEAEPRWDLAVGARARPSLSPSVWRKTGCHSHFWLRAGRVHWCD